jgi:hypothetical protein
MALTRLDNLYSSKTGRYLYVSPDDFNATDELDNRGNSPLRPFKTIQRAFIEVARYSYLPGRNNDRFDQFSIMLMPGNHYIDNRPGIIDVTNPEPRYLDGANLIEANRQEIIDRAFGEIAIQYDESAWGNNWVVPRDTITTDLSRFFDAYRLIQRNRKEISDKALAKISLQYPDFFFPGDDQTNDKSRYFDAYRLIVQNKEEIVNTAWSNLIAEYPAVSSTEAKCKRDIGFFVDAIATDIFIGGNYYAREFALQYFDNSGAPISNGLIGEETESVYAFEQARNLIKQAVSNQLTIKDLTLTADPSTGSNTNPASCADVQATVETLTAIITTVIASGDIELLPELTEADLTPGSVKCLRDIGYFIDAVSLDVVLGGGNRYSRKFIQNYFNAAGNAWLTNTLEGEQNQSIYSFNAARDLMISAITNQLNYKDLTITADPATGSNTDPTSCADVKTTIFTLTTLITDRITANSLSGLPSETVGPLGGPGQSICKRDIGFIVDAIAADLKTGGNSNIIQAARSYFDRNGNPISNGLIGEETQSVIAFNAARDMMKKAVTNQLYSKDLTLLEGPSIAGGSGPIEPILPSGNENTCVDVQNTIGTLISILTQVIIDGNLSSLSTIQVTGDIPVFNYNRALEEWNDNSILDLSNPDNVLYKFNASTGGAIVPRGCSLIGYDLRRTIVRPLYVPDPADGTQARTSVFNLTGGCYIWQFTIKDGDLSSNSPLFDPVANVGKVYFQKGNTTQLAIPEYSHHKICIMEYADNDELDKYYTKVGRAFAKFQPTIDDDGEFEALVQENRIVGPLSDTRRIDNIQVFDSAPPGKLTLRVTTKIDHGYFVDQYIAILNTGLNDTINGTVKVTAIDPQNPRIFEYQVDATTSALGLISGQIYTNSNGLSTNAVAQAEIDSVESASPYVFNCSIRSTWGMCGMWADGAKATGFKSMVVAQYTGVSLQKDDRAFIRYDKFTNTWNQASLTDAFATIPYHTKGDAYWKDDWRNFHIRASDDAFIQNVSVFAVGFFDHFLMESGGDMSITNSNSNFGNTSLHAIGFKGFSFNQDKGGYITDIIPPRIVNTSSSNEKRVQYYPLDIQASNSPSNDTRLYLGSDDATDPSTRPAASIEGFRIGARTEEKLYVKLDNGTYYSTIEPNGFVSYTASLQTLNPAGIQIDNVAQDAANRIEDNKRLIQSEAYRYILQKYPYLLTRPSINIAKCERDIGYFVDAVVQDLRLGGNINTVQAAEGYYVGGSLAYITQELDETIETLDYVKNMAIAAMRNFDVLLKNCQTMANSPIVNVGDTSGLLIGMSVSEYNPLDFTNGKPNNGVSPVISNIPAGTYIKRILDDQRIELGEFGSKLEEGATVNALQNSSTAFLYFDYQTPAWASIQPTKDNTLIQDTNYPECANIATTISQYFVDIFVILNQGLTPLGGRQIDAHNLILANKELIAEVAVARMLANFPGFSVPGGNQNCIDDIIDVLEAIAFNVKYGGNNKVYDAGAIYISGQHVEGEEDQAVYAFLEARDMAIQAMRNESITITGSSRTQFIDSTVIVDPMSPACADVATAITSLMAIITQAIGTSTVSGSLTGITKVVPTITSVTRIEPNIDFAGLAKRATLFTINTGGASSNPHQFETGTPVRLIPRAKPGTNPDKRVIRLPRGFNTNTKYYVIAPGRFTQPEDYSGTTVFDGSDQTKLMLAATKENAAAGIYIYSPETDSVDPDVEIEIQQYALDSSYDLHQYRCNLAGAGEIETDIANIFDLPNPGVQPQKVFFRVAEDILGSELPSIAGLGKIDSQKYYYIRFINTKKFSVHETHVDAIAGVNAISFVPASGQNFYVFADKRTSPLKFDAEYRTPSNTTGLWYLQVRDESSGANLREDSILTRFHDVNAYGPGSGRIRTLDTWVNRLQDTRTKEDRAYRLRYVIPKYLETVRDPLNGFVLKVRTDDKRRLVPQKFVLKPIGGAPTVARFDNPEQTGERIGYTTEELLLTFGINNPTYDPYFSPKVVNSDRTQSKIAFTIQSARKVTQDNQEYLEITAFDHEITNEALKNEIFVVAEINFPQGGVFTVNNITASSSNFVTWTGASSGSGYIQGYFEDNGRYFLVLKNITGQLKYNNLVTTRFTQGAVFADLIAKPNSVGDPTGKDKSDRRDYLYRIEGANVYTLVPGDVITDDANNQYRIENVQDVGNIEDTFYIFDIDEVQERIPGQQDGIYYLTCVRGNISPFPTGAGVGENFRNYKFSQPISQLYPVNYKNDPIWYKQINPVYNDPPATVAAADNYIHGLVTINDSKNNATKEVVEDLVLQPALNRYEFVKSDELSTPTLNPVGGSNIIEAQEGSATSGSENRFIPISGNSEYPTERRLYVELRRPSIARSGNHTFEYLGFGPGNYSTGFPLRQEVVLSDLQDFYAQSKKEDGGIVFYTGLNSNGDLYIGNRKVNAITGEETFLEKADLGESDDDSTDLLGGLVTTFDTPVTFNDRITVEGNASFNSPVEINVGADEGVALRIYSVVDANVGDDVTLGRAQFANANDGDITLSKNRINSAIFGITPRQILGLDGQGYSVRTHFVNGVGPTNLTPDQTRLFNATQEVSYSASLKPKSGDILLKGSEVGLSGSLGWIFANYYTEIGASSIQSITSDGVRLTIEWAPGIRNSDLNVAVGSQIRITNFALNFNLNGIWTVLSQDFLPNSNTCKIQVTIPPASGVVYVWAAISGAKMEVGRTNWKETGIIGTEALRTETETWGKYKLGINTLARATNNGYLTAFVQQETSPVANLDVVGNTFISGKDVNITVSSGVQTKTIVNLDNAFLVGGEHLTPNNAATLRVATTNNGRVGINATNDQLDRALVVVGQGRITGDFRFESDIEVNGGDITTTNSTFNVVNQSTLTTFSAGAFASTANLFNSRTGSQTVNIGTLSSTSTLNVHTGATNSVINLGTVANTPSTNRSVITIGGAFSNPPESIFRVRNYRTIFDGRLTIRGGQIEVDAGTNQFTLFPDGLTELRIGGSTGIVEIGGVAGRTTIRHGLRVLGATTLESDVTQNGGFRNSNVGVDRNIFGTIRIQTVQRSGNVATITTTQPHNLTTNDLVTIRASIESFNTLGNVSVTVTGSNTFTYSNSGVFVAPTTATGTIIRNIGINQPSGSLANLNIDYYAVVENFAASMNITAVSNNKLFVNNLYVSPNDPVRFTDAGNLVGINTSTVYYVRTVDSTGFTITEVLNGAEVLIGIQEGASSPGSAKIGLAFTLVDTLGDEYWGSQDFLNPDGSYRLPINNPSNIVVNQFLLLGTEIVRTVTDPTPTSPYSVNVLRAQDGTAAVSHPDGERIVQLIRQENASFIGPNPVTGGETVLNIGELSAFLRPNDIFRLNKGTQFEEFVRINAINTSDARSLTVTNGDFGNELNPKDPLEMFKVISTSGNTQIVGDVVIGYDVNSANENPSNTIALADAFGFTSSTSIGASIPTSGGGNLKVHNSIELSGNTSTTTPQKQYFVITNGSAPRLYVESATGNTRLYNGANFTVFKDSFFADGVFDKNRIDAATNVAFRVAGATGNTVVAGSLRAGSDFTVGTLQNPANTETPLNPFTTRFSVEAVTGTTFVGRFLTIDGLNGGTNLSESVVPFAINNLGTNGTSSYKIKQDRSIDAFGEERFYNRNGGRKTVFIATQGNTDASAINLRPNLQYVVRPASTLILRLPSNAITGDVIRIVDVGGALSFAINLVVRAPAGIRMQGKLGGSRLGGLGSEYGSGELVVNTPNAGFGLIYVGDTDGDNNGVPGEQQGWFLMEI